MMKVYYYTCPLEAGYMAKYYGVEFYCEDGCWTDSYFYDDPLVESYYQINPISLHIYDEHVGDVLLQHIENDTDWFRLGYTEQLSCYIEPEGIKTIILRRDGKPFFMPKEKIR